MHLKRQKIPKNWPIKRKGTKYLVRPNSNLTKGIPILIILRDMLKVAQNRREVKRIIHSKQLLLNNKFVKDDKACAVLFDTLEIVPSKKFYKISLAKTGKFTTEEIKKEESNHKISKIVNKKILKGKKIQINLSDGRNFISNVKCKINDSLLTNFKDKKVEKCIPMKEKGNAIAFAGKHAGIKGSIEKIDHERKIAEINIGERKINVLLKQLMVIE